MRLGFRLLKGMRQPHAAAIVAARPFTSVAQFHQATGLPAAAVRQLAEADAFASIGRTRRPAAWDALGLPDSPVMVTPADPPPPTLPFMPLGQEVMADYATAGLSLKCHPVSLIRPQLTARGTITAADLRDGRDRRWVSVAGLVLVRQRPGTAAGIVFMTIEDETGVANLIVRPTVYDRFKPAARHAMLLGAEGAGGEARAGRSPTGVPADRPGPAAGRVRRAVAGLPLTAARGRAGPTLAAWHRSSSAPPTPTTPSWAWAGLSWRSWPRATPFTSAT